MLGLKGQGPGPWGVGESCSFVEDCPKETAAFRSSTAATTDLAA